MTVPSPSNLKVTKRSIDTSGHDVAIAAGLAIVGTVSLLLTGFVVWYFRRQANPGKKSRRQIDLLEDHTCITVDMEKALQERPHSMALSLASSVLSTDTRAIIVAPPTPVTPVHTTTRQRVIDVIRPFSTAGAIPLSFRAAPRTRHSWSSDTIGNGTTTAIPSIRVPAPTASASYHTTGSRLTIGVNPTKEDVLSFAPSETAETNVRRFPSVYHSKPARKRRPSDLLISPHISHLDEKGKATPNVPASPSKDEWSAGPVATPLTSYTVQVPTPSSAGLPFRSRDIGSPLTITAAYPLSSVTIEDISSVHYGVERRGRIVKLSVLLEDSPIEAPHKLVSEKGATPNDEAEDLDRTHHARSSAGDLPPYTPVDEHHNRR